MALTRFLPTYRNIWILSFPLIIASISETVVGITDTIFLSRYGTTELAALGMANTIYGVALFLILGLVDGIQITIGRRAGEEQHRAIGKVLNQGLYLLAAASALMIAAVLLAVPLATEELFESADVQKSVIEYLSIGVFGLLPHAFNLALSAFYVGISRTRVFIGATLVLAGVNIVLDYLLIFGNLGFREMGIEGAAIASLCAEIAFSLVILIDILRRGYIREYGLFVFEKFDRVMAKSLSLLSAPVSMEVLVESFRWFLFFLIIEQMGEEALAIATIISSCYALLLIPIDAFAETICSMVSNLIGQKDGKKLASLVRKTVKLGYLTIVPVVAVVVLYPHAVLAVFSSEGTMIAESAGALIVITAATLVAVPAVIMHASVAGTGDTAASLGIEIVTSVFVLGFAYYAALVASLPLASVWFAEVIGWVICLALSWYWLRSGLWRRMQI